MNAVILAGGFGSRLKPLTDEIIKPMLTLANTPTLDYTVSHLSHFGIKDFVFTLSHKPEQVIEWAISYKEVSCHFSIETLPLGTLGGVKAAARFLDDTFIVVSGDALENIDFDAMLHKHRSSKALVTMAVKEEKNTELYGVVEFDAWGTVTGFAEKPPKGQEKSKYINCGIYIVEKKVLDGVPGFTKYDFSKDLFPQILSSGGVISAYIHDGYWCDIGDIGSYYKANFDVFETGFYPAAANSRRIEYAAYHIGDGAGRSMVSASSTLVGHIDNCIVGRDCRISSGAVLEKCIILDGAVARGRYTGAIIGKDFIVNLMQYAHLNLIQQNSAQNLNIFS